MVRMAGLVLVLASRHTAPTCVCVCACLVVVVVFVVCFFF